MKQIKNSVENTKNNENLNSPLGVRGSLTPPSGGGGQFGIAIKIFLVFTILTGVVYPLLVTGIARTNSVNPPITKRPNLILNFSVCVSIILLFS